MTIELPMTLRFGIASLDELVSGSTNARSSAVAGKPTSACISGPDGTGKSILGLHLASSYAFEASNSGTQLPLIFYASTDLTHTQADRTWNQFALRWPFQRLRALAPEASPSGKDVEVSLVEYAPFEVGHVSPLSAYLNQQRTKSEVAFVNLATNTAGDDWTYVDRVIAALPIPRGLPHLMIIDAVEGLETFVGEVDAFGAQRSRRSRIAQVMRTAAGKCHLVFVIEEALTGQRLPEQFVTDTVIRLRSTEMSAAGRSYSRRTLEVEKTRGQPHVRGQHVYVVRDGSGSRSGDSDDDFNQDELQKKHPRPDQSLGMDTMSYVRVYHSLHYVNRGRVLGNPSGDPTPTPSGERIRFGIRHFDNMLINHADARLRGLPSGSMTALIGDSGTHKMQLSMAFLAECFRPSNEHHVPVFVTLDNRSRSGMSRAIAEFLPGALDDAVKRVSEKFVYRRLVPQDTPSSVLVEIIRNNIQSAIKMRGSNAHVRIVIGNLSTMRAAYPDLEQDPLFLPSLVHMLREHGVSALLVNSEPGSPTAAGKSAFSRSLRGLVDHHLYTWHVPFFGEDRVAVAAIPAIEPGHPPLVRELVRRNTSPKMLDVDPHFEIYKGLYEGVTPELIPLRVWLFGSGTAFDSYLSDLNARFDDLFEPSLPSKHIVTASPAQKYEELRAFIDLHRDTRLDHTTVVQVDEFWSEGQGVLRQEEYLLADMYEEDRNSPDRAADPFLIFQKTSADRNDTQRKRRLDYFDPVGFDYTEALQDGNGKKKKELDRVPYTWDFGFVLLRSAPWEAAFHERFVRRYPFNTAGKPGDDEVGTTVGDIWYRLVHPKIVPESARRADKIIAKEYRKPGSATPVSWREFLHACSMVARSEASRAARTPPAFDIDLTAPETLSCLVLEIWASELNKCLGCSPANPAFKRKRHEPRNVSLLHLLADVDEQHRAHHLLALYKTFLLLGEVMSPAQFGTDHFNLNSKPADAMAVASRHWYSTACPFMAQQNAQDPVEPIRLPGNWSVRGDWFLAVASGSRSPRLGHRAIDLLSSRRANVERLQMGLGLPTRHFVSPEKARRAWTRLCTMTDTGVPMWVSYGELVRLGLSQDDYVQWRKSLNPANDEAKIADELAESGAVRYESGTDHFNWLWRYTIQDYDRHARLWLKMLFRIMVRWQGMLAKDARNDAKLWRSSFELYDWLEGPARETVVSKIDGNGSFGHFKQEVNGWLEGLRNCTPGGTANI